MCRGGSVRERRRERRRKIMCRVEGSGWEAESRERVEASGRTKSGGRLGREGRVERVCRACKITEREELRTVLVCSDFRRNGKREVSSLRGGVSDGGSWARKRSELRLGVSMSWLAVRPTA